MLDPFYLNSRKRLSIMLQRMSYTAPNLGSTGGSSKQGESVRLKQQNYQISEHEELP